MVEFPKKLSLSIHTKMEKNSQQEAIMNIKQPKLWSYLFIYFLINCLLSLITLVLMYLNPSEIDQAIFLGFSGARLFQGTIPAISVIVFTYLAVISKKHRPNDALEIKETWFNSLFILSLFLFLIGTILFFTEKVGSGGYLVNYLSRLLPLFIWSIWIGLSSMVMLLLITGKNTRLNIAGLLIFFFLIILSVSICVRLWPLVASTFEDIYFTYLEGSRILDGKNPYSRIIQEGYREGGKFPTYFSGFYLVSALSQEFGLISFEQWISLWKLIFLFFTLLIATLLYYLPFKKKLIFLSIFSFIFWVFNRWTIHLLRVSEMDFIPLFFLILSLASLKKHPRLSFLMFGFSLSIKQVGIFLLPLYIYWAWEIAPKESRLSNFLTNAFLIMLAPVITSFPFMIWDYKGFIASIVVSFMRAPAALDNLYSISANMSWTGYLGSLPMVLLLFLAYAIAMFYKTGPFLASLMVMLVYAGFSNAFFPSNFIWVIPLFPLSVNESLENRRTGS